MSTDQRKSNAAEHNLLLWPEVITLIHRIRKSSTFHFLIDEFYESEREVAIPGSSRAKGCAPAKLMAARQGRSGAIQEQHAVIILMLPRNMLTSTTGRKCHPAPNCLQQ